MPDDRGVDQDVERLGGERAERRKREPKDLAVVRRAETHQLLRRAANHARAARLGDRLDHDLVEVDVWRPRQREENAVGDLVRR